MENEFSPWNGDYEKQHYDVLMNDGNIIEQCWPNAGKMIVTQRHKHWEKIYKTDILKSKLIKGIRVSKEQYGS